MKKNIVLMRLCKLLCLLLCLVLLSGVAVDCFRYYDYNVMRLEGFYSEPKNSLDVVFLGASDVFTDFSSGLAYDQFGFTSYPFAQDANPGIIYQSQLLEVIKRQNPQKIVVEINGFLYDSRVGEAISGPVRRYLNCLPQNWNRLETAWKVAPEGEEFYYLFPWAKDHSNWKSFPEQFPLAMQMYRIRFGGSRLKGNVSTMNRYQGPDSRDVSSDMTTMPLDENSEQDLRDFLLFCRENHPENILFVRFPHVISTDETYERFCRGNEAGRIIEEYGFEYLNLEKEFYQIGLEPEDFYNEDHMNIYGQQKFTDYFGRILTEKYHVTKSEPKGKLLRDWEEAVFYSRRFYAYADAQISQGKTGTLFEDPEQLEILKNWE